MAKAWDVRVYAAALPSPALARSARAPSPAMREREAFVTPRYKMNRDKSAFFASSPTRSRT